MLLMLLLIHTMLVWGMVFFLMISRTISLKPYLDVVHTMTAMCTMMFNINISLTINQPCSTNSNTFGVVIRGGLNYFRKRFTELKVFVGLLRNFWYKTIYSATTYGHFILSISHAVHWLTIFHNRHMWSNMGGWLLKSIFNPRYE